MLFFSAIEFQNQTRKEFEEPYHCLRWLPENFISVFSYQNLKEIMMSVAVTACLTFYRKDFLNKNNIKWIDKKLCYEDSPFFVESFLKAQRVGAINQKFYHRRVHKKAITQNMSENFLDYCEICRLTLKIAKKYGDDIVFSRLFYGYIRKSYLNYLMLTDSVKIKYVQNLLNLYTDLKNEYALPLPDEIEEMLENFTRKPLVSGKKKIGILYIATGNYISFWENFYNATEKYFLSEHEKTYFLFTDQTNLKLPANVVRIPIVNELWPYITLKRYHFFLEQKEILKNFDYLYFMNGNLIFSKMVGNEIMPTVEQGLMVTIHPWYLSADRKRFTYETNKKSKAYIDAEEGKYYFMGGFNGGTSCAFLEMSENIKNWTDADLAKNIIPVWHDESMLNRYMIDYMKDKSPLILLPIYTVPQEMDLKWDGIRGILLDKIKALGIDYLKEIKKIS